MMLDLESRVLLSLIAKTSFGKDIPFLHGDEKIEDANWEKVYTESVQQTVALFAASAISPYKNVIPDEVFGKWLAFSGRTFTTNMFVANYQNELVKYLDKNEYKYIILKGLSSAYYYENPDMRMLGDVDFLIEGHKKDEISQNIQNDLKYSLHNDLDHICHVTMLRGRAAIEMHFEIPGIPYGDKGEYVRNFIKNILEDTQKVTLDGCEFTAPSHLYHGIIILLHMLHHMSAEGLGLRHLCDWGAFVNKTANMDFWETDFVPFLKKINLLTYASAMASICKKYMGIDMPNCMPVADDSLCEDMMNEILQSGNFGNKDEQYQKSGLLVSEHGKGGTNKSIFSVLLGQLDSAVKLHWPWLKKWKILLPFAYVYFALRYYCRVLMGKRPSLTSLMPEANRRKELYKKLEIYEDTE
ncbi:MAG: nucleotidyltransferase family protein [Clostridia bacterium]|nr:nucleotidyltransferase family protein [Clostridia bacterium]